MAPGIPAPRRRGRADQADTVVGSEATISLLLDGSMRNQTFSLAVRNTFIVIAYIWVGNCFICVPLRSKSSLYFVASSRPLLKSFYARSLTGWRAVQ